MEPMGHLSGKVAVVTGGGRGIGNAIALELARAGADLAIAGREHALLEATAAQLQQCGRRVLTIPLDLRREDQILKMAGQVRARLGPVDILVNNAATIGPTARLEHVSRAEWDDVLAVNL